MNFVGDSEESHNKTVEENTQGSEQLVQQTDLAPDQPASEWSALTSPCELFWLHTHMNADIRIAHNSHTCMHIHNYTYMYVKYTYCMYIVCVRACVCVCICMYVCMYVCLYVLCLLGQTPWWLLKFGVATIQILATTHYSRLTIILKSITALIKSSYYSRCGV